MTERSLVIRLRADVAQAIAGLSASAAAVKDFAGQALTAADKQKQSWTKVGTAFAATGVVIEAALIASAVAAAQFDKAMSAVKANVDDKTVPSMARLRQAALDAGTTTVFSATEAADAENELAKAGISAADIVGGALHASLILASAGNIGLADSAAIVSATMVQFGLHASDAAHVADVLSAGADKSLGGVQDLGEALKYAGVQASQAGVSLDQTVGSLALFASYGIIGSMAGTGLRQVMLSLQSPTTAAGGAMKQYGINVYDTQGKFVGLDQVAGQLHDKLGGLTQQQQQVALATIFTNRSIAEANILMKAGAQGVDKWTSAVNDQGFAAGQASTKLDNLSGDVTKFRNTINVDLVDAGETASGELRGVVQDLTSVGEGFHNLDPALQGFVVTVAAQTGGIALLGGAALLVIPKIAAMVKAMKELSILQTIGLGPIAAIAATGAAVVGGVDIAGALTRQQHDNEVKAAQSSQGQLAADRLQLAELQKRVTNTAGSDLGRAGGLGRNAALSRIAELKSIIQAAGVAADKTGNSLAAATKAQDALIPSVQLVGGAYQTSDFDLTTFTKDLDGLRKSILPLQAAQDQLTKDAQSLTAAVKSQAKQFKDTGHAVAGNSAEALANRAALRGMTADTIGVIEAYAAQGHSSDQVAAKTASMRDKFIELATKAGFTKTQIKDYIGQIDLVPSTIRSNVILNGVNQAGNQLAYLAALAQAIDADIHAAAAKAGGQEKAALERIAHGQTRSNASGSQDYVGGYSRVGEDGPEVVWMPPHSKIWPTGRMPSGVNAPAIYVQNPFTGDYLLAKVGSVTQAALSSAARSVAGRSR